MICCYVLWAQILSFPVCQHFERPYTLIEEDPQYRRAGAVVRVEQMFEEIIARLPGHPDFLLCVLPERKNSELYGNVLC